MATSAASQAIDNVEAPPGSVGWQRFSLRGLLLVMTLCCVLLGVWAAYVEPYRVQGSIMAMVGKLNGSYETELEQGAAWQRWLVTTALGNDRFVRVTGVDLSATAANDATLAEVGRLRGLEELKLDRSRITDRGLASLRGLEKLRVLSLRYCQISDDGLAAVETLPRKLEELALTGARITDASAAWFEGRSITDLFIRWTDITDDGARRIDSLMARGAVHHHSYMAE